MMKIEKKILKIVSVLFFLGLSSIFLSHYLTPSVSSNYIEDKLFNKMVEVTDNPLVKKRWQRLQLITESINKFKFSKTILLWTKFFGATDYVPKLSDMCAVPKCLVTSNRIYLNKSDAIIFHLRDLNLKDMPLNRTSNQVWIMLHHESPPHTPDILHQLNGVFNWTATYRFDSEILLTPVVVKKEHPLEIETRNYFKSKRKMVAWMASNCNTPGKRENFVGELQKSFPVDIYGSCGEQKCLPKMSSECYVKIGNIYKFYLSFENSICKDYVTEKLFNILTTNTIPVVFGGANYSSVAPPNSYIDAQSFKTPRDLAKYLIQVGADEKLYNSYFEWRKTYEITGEHYACKICKMLHEPLKQKVYSNISHWWFTQASCRSWSL